MNEVIRQFIEYVENKHHHELKSVKEYQALIALVRCCDDAEEIPSDEPFKKYHCHDCGATFYEKTVEEPKKPKKQTLLEFMDKKARYSGRDPQTAPALNLREIYRNISEYLEKKED